MKDKHIAKKGQSPLNCAFVHFVNTNTHKDSDVQVCSPLDKKYTPNEGAISSLKNQPQASLRLASREPTQ